MKIGRNFLLITLLAWISTLGVVGISQSPQPQKVGTSLDLSYPVLLIGQSSLDVRDSIETLTAVRGHSSLNLNERQILDSRGRLFQVKRAALLPGQPSTLLSLGNTDQLFFIDLAELPPPTLRRIQDIVLEQIQAPLSIYRNSARAVQEIRTLRNTKEIIEVVRERAKWL